VKTIGLLGGMTWHSTIEYYRLINDNVQKRLGGNHSAKCILYSVEFAEIEELQDRGAWDTLAGLMIQAARRVEQAGADFIVICANTMHQMAPEVEKALSIPLLHIADATAGEIRKQNLGTVGLLGTRYTMELDFYRRRLEQQHGLNVLVPPKKERDEVHRIIYEELGQGIVAEDSREVYRSIIRGLQARGAQGVILGCTEIPLLIGPEDSPVPVFDTTALHAAAAVERALASELPPRKQVIP
jgi:aspartate racemase